MNKFLEDLMLSYFDIVIENEIVSYSNLKWYIVIFI